MSKPVHHPHSLPFIIFIFFLLSIHDSHQLQPSQSQAILNIQQLLNYPPALTIWDQATDFCNTDPTPYLTLSCYEDNITQLHIIGFGGNSTWVPPLPPSFSDSFFTTLSALPTLKVLSLVSLGLWGPLPSSISTLSSLEILNLSSNHFNGSIPQEISSLRSLQTIILDNNQFTGQVPGWFSSLPCLAVLSLKNNSLSGTLPYSLASLQNLRILALSNNKLSGEIPPLLGLTNLQTLDVGDNQFGPHFPITSNKTVTLVLRKNRFGFGIPAELSSFYHLQKLDVSSNRLAGPFPPSLLSLPSLSYLDIAGNKFTGILSKNTSCGAELGFVNLSSNRLTGELPACLRSNSSGKVVVVYAGNCLSKSGGGQRPYSVCRNEALAVRIMPQKRGRKPVGRVVLGSSLVGGLGGIIALCGLLLLATRKVFAKQGIKSARATLILEKVSPAYTIKLLSDARYISETMKLGALGLPLYRTFALEELKEATGNFGTLNLIGKRSECKVYKGMLTDGTPVAIRCLKMRKRHSIQSYTHQIELISRLRHRHLVSTVGHCFECYPDDSSVSTIYLVFEFVPNGTLRSYISEGLSGQKFNWTQRISAAIGVAKGIQFLHTGMVPGVFANDLKITDVLLDHDLHVKISNYNLPLLDDTRSQLGSAGAFLTEQNEQNRGISHEDKKDVYDMGVILLEIIVGRAIMSQSAITVAKDLLQVSLGTDDAGRRSIADPAIQKECSDESLKTLMEISVRCVSIEPKDRPSVEDVLWNLEFAAQVQVQVQVPGTDYSDSENTQGSPILSPKPTVSVTSI